MRFAPAFFAAGLLWPLDVVSGCSFAMTCDETPERVMAASPAFSTWRREASIFNGLKVLIRPELQTSGTWCYIVSRFPLRPFKTRIVLLFISIHDSAYYVIFSTSFRLILAIR
jgi:hypothetical protein